MTFRRCFEQIGMDVTLIPAEKLATEDLSQYQTIVLGIRAYDTQKDVIANNKRLLEFVEAGGRLVVQYNASAWVRRFQWREIHAVSGDTEPGAGFGGRGAGDDSRSGEPDFSFSQRNHAEGFRRLGAGARPVLHVAVGHATLRRCSNRMIRAKASRRAGCSSHTTARARTSTRDMRSSGSCRRECRERCGCL